MLKRLILAILVGIATALVVYLIGVVLALLPVVAPLGVVLQGLAWIFGIVAGVWFFLTGERFWG